MVPPALGRQSASAAVGTMNSPAPTRDVPTMRHWRVEICLAMVIHPLIIKSFARMLREQSSFLINLKLPWQVYCICSTRHQSRLSAQGVWMAAWVLVPQRPAHHGGSLERRTEM